MDFMVKTPLFEGGPLTLPYTHIIFRRDRSLTCPFYIPMIFRGLLLIMLLFTYPTSAQDEVDNPLPDDERHDHPWYVFLQDGEDDTSDELIFVDALTGQQTILLVNGERFTLYDGQVMFFDTVYQQVMMANTYGELYPHPFIQLGANHHRVDWLVSDDKSQIAWTLAGRDARDRLTTITTVANIDGTNPRQVLAETDDIGSNLRSVPVSFDDNIKTLYMGTHIDGISEHAVFQQYVSFFSLDMDSGETEMMAGETLNCICGAALQGNKFLRLRLTDDFNAFDLHIHNTKVENSQVLAAIRLSNYETAGDILISPDGSKAIYALGRVTDFGGTNEEIQTVFVLVDLDSLTQEVWTNPISTYLRPVEWTDDNSAIIFTSPDQRGTWKISLSDGRLERIADASYLGTLGE
jgi:hypothetical protein